MISIDDEWIQYLSNQNANSFGGRGVVDINESKGVDLIPLCNEIAPKCDDLYISTKIQV